MTAVVASFADVYSSALLGERCKVVGLAPVPHALPVHAWTRTATGADRVVLRHCHGPTLDVGCGPGRMAAELAALGLPVLAIDVVPEAVRQARDRGVLALLRDVFDPLPAEGRWASALLADGNIGIGGDPRRLLTRLETLLEPGGRVVVDLAPPGTGIRTRSLRLITSSYRSKPFRWTVVGADVIGVVTAGTGLTITSVHQEGDRWFAVLGKAGRSRAS